MVKPIRPKPQMQMFNRRGEGTSVDVVQQHVIGTDGKTLVTQNINVRNAPVPERRYAY